MRREFRALAALLTRVARTTGRGSGEAERSLRLRDDAPFTRQGFPVARKSWGGEVGETPRPARMCQHPPDPRRWARESSPSAVRTGGGAGKPAQTGVVSAFEVAGEGARAGSSQGSRSGLCRSCGNPARCPQCGGDGGLGKPGGSAPAWSSASVAGVPS